MTEIRVQDLRFTMEETAEYLQKMLGKTLEDGIVELLDKKNRRLGNGFAAGCPFIAASRRFRPGVDGKAREPSSTP
jgi:ATP/maltotriose-dependent transcriptional regulator MalT